MKIAIVEDNSASAEKLRGYLRQYGEENQKEFDITLFGDAVSFLDRYSPFDMVFMDIELPGMDGMEAARRLREVDRQAILLFVTNMARFAVKGYEVDAMDYLVKPVQYGSFSLKLRRALARWEQTSETILVSQPNGFQRLLLREIRYLEVSSHKLIYHTTAGPVSGAGTLVEAEEKLHSKGFLRCNKCYLVNYKHVVSVQGSDLVLTGGERLLISRPRKKSFMAELAAAMGCENVL